MRTPSRRSSRPGSVASRTPSRPLTQTRSAAASSPLLGKRIEDIPIDPVLLAEEAGEEDDAEGEEDEEEIIPVYSAKTANGHRRTPSQASSLLVKPAAQSSSRLRRSHSIRMSVDPLDSLSPSSSLTPAPSKKRGRPPKTKTPAAVTLLGDGTPLANGKSKSKGKGKAIGNSKGKGKGKANAYLTPGHHHPLHTSTSGDVMLVAQPHGYVLRDEQCSFCHGSDDRNKLGKKERMVSCVRCGRSGHPTCLNMLTPRLARAVMAYDWCCIECKTCEVCMVKGQDEHLLFCDSCDRGWHGYCLDPPFASPPKGAWHCPLCTSNDPRYRPTSSTAAHPAPGKYISHPSTGRKGKERAMDLGPGAIDTPTIRRKPGRPPKVPNHTDVFDARPRIKLKARKSTDWGVTPDVEPSPGPVIKVRLRVPSGGRRTVEVENEEEKVPFGGVISGPEADTTKTSITDSDKAAFDKSRRAAEDKLGGPPPPLWDPQASTAGSPAPSSHHGSTPVPSKSALPQSSLSRPLRDRLLQQSLADIPAGPSTPSPSNAHHTSSQKIKTIRFGVYDIDTWYSAPYPEEYQHVPDGRLWLCEFCLKYMKSGFVAGRHRMKCKARHPPGDEIYRDGSISVFEVDGRKNKIYCQNLCLLAKMFLDHKTLYYDVEPFLFYVMTEVDDLGARFVGYFSKEKRSPDNNVSCIMTLPVRQRRGWGQLLIDFSYLLSKKEGRVGSPEKPLSGLGAVTYKRYWQLSVFQYLRHVRDNPSMDEISTATSMTLTDIYATLVQEDMIRVQESPSRDTPSQWRGGKRGRGRPPVSRKPPSSDSDDEVEIPKRYTIIWDKEYVEAVLRKHEAKGHLTLNPERLKYHPFLVTRNPPKPPGMLAQATLMPGHTHAALAAHAQHQQQSTHADLKRDDSESTTNREVVATPAGDDVSSSKDTTDRIVAGEDAETLALVASLSVSPRRNLRKRASEELTQSARKKLRSSDVPSSPINGRRRSLRGVASVDSNVDGMLQPSDLGMGGSVGTPRRRSARDLISNGVPDPVDSPSQALGAVADAHDPTIISSINGHAPTSAEVKPAAASPVAGSGLPTKKADLSMYLDEEEGQDEDAEGEDEDAEGEDYVEEVTETVDDPEEDAADADWGEDEDAEGEEDEEYME